MTKRNKESIYEFYDEMVDWFDDARTKTLMELEYLVVFFEVNSSWKGGASILCILR